ncbi:MAG: HIT family protein, partial [Lachnospiraceae bacterium]|nr:HIT family protein [Lachnospiraceae bacterium]
NLLQNSGEAAWQSVFHLHIHLIPRYNNDNVMVPWEHLSYADGEAEEYAAKIRACL